MKNSNNKNLCQTFLLFSFSILIFSGFAAPQSIIEPEGVPAAEELIVIKNNKLIFDLFGENLEYAKVLKKGVIEPPKYGKVKFNGNESVTYQPNKDICEELDEFTYFIKTPRGFDTLSVKVEILCESLTIMSGFTPDGDGVNDSFTILGVQNYPDNSLLIFNKWGEQVYAKKGYQNDWSGSETKGQSLASEDSVYYYVFDDGTGKSYSGYLQILAKS